MAGAGLTATFGLLGAPAASPLLGTILTGAATGAGSLAIKNGPGQNRGFGEDFMKGLFVGAVIGAASSAAGYGTASLFGLGTTGILSWSTAFSLGYSFGLEAGAKALGIVDPTSWWALASRAYKSLFGRDLGNDLEVLALILIAPGVPGWLFPGGGGIGNRQAGGALFLNAIPLAP
jgi:hypothetical protein